MRELWDRKKRNVEEFSGFFSLPYFGKKRTGMPPVNLGKKEHCHEIPFQRL
jgi:hypothetical protein